MSSTTDFPTVSVVIPSLDGNQEDLNRLEEAVRDSGIPTENLEVIASIGIQPNGRARDAGAIRASGDYLIFMDADVSFPEPGNLRTLIEFLDQHEEVGLAGTAQQLPDSLSKRERNKALQIPRSHVETVNTFRESDMVTHACLAIARDRFESIGMEHPNLISGTDPDLRHRVRSRGWKVGIVPDTRVEHPPVMELGKLLKKRFRMGRWSRRVKRRYPDYHLATTPDITTPSEADRNTLLARIKRNVSQFIQQLSKGQVRGILARVAYLLGYSVESLFGGERVDDLPYTPNPESDPERWDEFLEALKQEGTVLWLKQAPWSKKDSQPGEVKTGDTNHG